MRPAQQANSRWLRPRLADNPRQRTEHVCTALGLGDFPITHFLGTQLGFTSGRETVRQNDVVTLNQQQIRHGLMACIELPFAWPTRGIKAATAVQQYHGAVAGKVKACRVNWLKYQRRQPRAVQTVESDALGHHRKARSYKHAEERGFKNIFKHFQPFLELKLNKYGREQLFIK